MTASAYLVKGTDPSLRDRVVDDLVVELLGDDDRTLALEEITKRMSDFKLQEGAQIGYHSALNRAPLTVPITFTPVG